MKESLIERGKEIAAILLFGLEGIKARTGQIMEIRSRGLMVALELKDDPETMFTTLIHLELVRQGYVLGLRPGANVLRLDPSLTINQIDIEDFLETFETVLTDAKN